MYRRAHCCTDVASIAQVRLITKLKSQSELAQTEYPGVEKVNVFTADGLDPLPVA
jgi:hypothetical protein